MRNKIFLIALAILYSLAVPSQELKWKRKYKDGVTEEFYVLKGDKKIKQGPSLRTYKDMLDNKYVIDFGQYDQNMKSGRWLTFYYIVDPLNSLKTDGSYINNVKHGKWNYYYPATSSNRSIQRYLGAEIRTKVVNTKKKDLNFKIEYDTSEQQLLCAGQYEKGIKIGVWNYYSSTGYLLHSYDHDANTFVQNKFIDPDNDFLVFLGGPERFYNFYYMGDGNLKTQPKLEQTSEVIYEVEKSGNFKLVHASGDENYQKQVEDVLNSIPNEWIILDETSSKKLQLTAKLIVSGNTFNKYNYILEFKVVK